MIVSQLDPREEHFRIPSHLHRRSLFLRYLPPPEPPFDKRDRIVLYVHGGTFPSGLSIAHRFDGRSWRDELCAAGFHVWALDFHGFGRLSDPYPEMERPAQETSPLGRAADASGQLEQAIRFVCKRHGVGRLSIIAHSWGTIVTGLFAGRCPELVDRLVFFGPIARREPSGERIRLPGWRLISPRISGTVSPRRFRPANRRSCCAVISRNGASATSMSTRRAELVCRQR